MSRFLAVLFAMAISGCELDIPTARDADEGSEIVREMGSRYLFRVTTTDGTRPAVYFRPHPKFSEILVYGDYSPAEHEEILAVVQAIRKDTASKSIHLSFYPSEHDATEPTTTKILD